jgi:hypothetical protein
MTPYASLDVFRIPSTCEVVIAVPHSHRLANPRHCATRHHHRVDPSRVSCKGPARWRCQTSMEVFGTPPALIRLHPAKSNGTNSVSTSRITINHQHALSTSSSHAEPHPKTGSTTSVRSLLAWLRRRRQAYAPDGDYANARDALRLSETPSCRLGLCQSCNRGSRYLLVHLAPSRSCTYGGTHDFHGNLSTKRGERRPGWLWVFSRNVTMQTRDLPCSHAPYHKTPSACSPGERMDRIVSVPIICLLVPYHPCSTTPPQTAAPYPSCSPT